MSGARGEVIAYAAHSLVVERSLVLIAFPRASLLIAIPPTDKRVRFPDNSPDSHSCITT